MQAAICRDNGGPHVVELREVHAPVAKDNEVLIRVHASTVVSGDCRIRASNFPGGFWLPARLLLGLTRPRQPNQYEIKFLVTFSSEVTSCYFISAATSAAAAGATVIGGACDSARSSAGPICRLKLSAQLINPM